MAECEHRGTHTVTGKVVNRKREMHGQECTEYGHEMHMKCIDCPHIFRTWENWDYVSCPDSD